MKTVLNPNKTEALKVGNSIFRSVYDFRTTEDDLRHAFLNLGETEEKKAVSLHQLKKTLIGDKDFDYRLDDEYLLKFLRYKKFDVKKTYSTIRNFYVIREERPDIFDIPSNMDYILGQDILKLLPYKTEEGNVVIWAHINNWNLDKTSVGELMKITHIFSDVVTMNPSIQVYGVIGFWDVGGVTARQLAHVSYPSTIKTILASLLKLYPWRVKQIVVINCSPILCSFYAAYSYLLPRKIAERVVLLGSDMKKLHQYLNPRILPKMYGGCIETSECSVVQYMRDNLPYLQYERSFGRKIKDVS